MLFQRKKFIIFHLSMQNKNFIRAGISERKFRELLYLFWLDIEAGKVACGPQSALQA